jgi:hypothetical protein
MPLLIISIPLMLVAVALAVIPLLVMSHREHRLHAAEAAPVAPADHAAAVEHPVAA